MDSKLHLIQDSLESYCVFKLTELSEKFDLSISNNSKSKFIDYTNYCNERNIDPSKDKSAKIYWEMYQKHLPIFFNNLIKTYPNCKFDFIDVEKDFRNEKKKGDFVIHIKGNEIDKIISVSLKAYKGGFDSIQVCSGTFNSFINNFMFASDGVGMFKTEDGIRFKGSLVEKRNEVISNLGYSKMIPTLSMLDEILPTIKEKYVHSNEAEFFQNVENDWKMDCNYYGNLAIDLTLQIINENFSKHQVKQRILKMSGFDGSEDLLLIDSKKMIDSITSDKFKNLTKKLRSDDTTIHYYKRGKSIFFDFIDIYNKVILSVSVPFTLQKNGAWHLPSDGKSIFKTKENMFLEYGQRRPKKSKELNTSINTYVKLKNTGIL